MKPKWFGEGKGKAHFKHSKGVINMTQSYIEAVAALENIESIKIGEGFEISYARDEIAQMPLKNPVEGLRAALERYTRNNGIPVRVRKLKNIKPKRNEADHFVQITRLNPAEIEEVEKARIRRRKL